MWFHLSLTIRINFNSEHLLENLKEKWKNVKMDFYHPGKRLWYGSASKAQLNNVEDMCIGGQWQIYAYELQQSNRSLQIHLKLKRLLFHYYI